MSLFLLLSVTRSNHEYLYKKQWKEFNKSFSGNLLLAQNFYVNGVDGYSEDELTALPASKLPLPECTRNYLELEGFSCMYEYEFETESECISFFARLQKKLKKPKGYYFEEDATCIVAKSKEDVANNATAVIERYQNKVFIVFYPPWNIDPPQYQ